MYLTEYPIDQYPQLLKDKAKRVQQTFADLTPPPVEIFASQPAHFRMRAEFRLWHEGEDLYYAMFDPADPKTPVKIDDFLIASESICALMPRLLEAIKPCILLRRQLFQVEFLSTLAGDMLVTLIYHRKLDQQWQQVAQQLAAELSIKIIGRSRKQKCVLSEDFVVEALALAEETFCFRQYEGGFTQPNAQLNREMIQWAQRQVAQRPDEDLLELYCGNGNFTAPLSRCFRRVLATEISKTSVKAARENFLYNKVDNVDIVRMSSEDLTSALNNERPFKRLRDIDLSSYKFDTVFVDPPRAGLDEGTRALVSRFDQVLYISCNPATLHRDLQLLTKTHRFCAFALFDQFPYTDHMECGAFLQRG